MKFCCNETPHFCLHYVNVPLFDLKLLDKQHSRLYEDVVLSRPTPHDDANVTHDALCAMLSARNNIFALCRISAR